MDTKKLTKKILRSQKKFFCHALVKYFLHFSFPRDKSFSVFKPFLFMLDEDNRMERNSLFVFCHLRVCWSHQGLKQETPNRSIRMSHTISVFPLVFTKSDLTFLNHQFISFIIAQCPNTLCFDSVSTFLCELDCKFMSVATNVKERKQVPYLYRQRFCARVASCNLFAMPMSETFRHESNSRRILVIITYYCIIYGTSIYFVICPRQNLKRVHTLN